MKNKYILSLIILIGFIFRSFGLLSRPIWYDEAFSVLLAEQGPDVILKGTLATDAGFSASEEHPPAYYFVLWAWMQLFGNSLVAARLLSIAISLGTIFFLFLIGQQLFNKQTALTAAFLAAILPFQVHYAVEIRMYGFLAFWLTLATLALLQRRWILFSLAAALAQYTHSLAAIYLIPLALTPLLQQDWKTLFSVAMAGFAALGLYTPWLIQLPSQLSKVTSNFWIEKPGIEKLFTLFLMYLPHLPLSETQIIIGLFASTLVIVLAIVQTYSTHNLRGVWLAYLAFTPPVILWLISQIFPLYVERAFLPSHVIFCLWLAWAFTQTKTPRAMQAFAFTLIFMAAGIGLFQHTTYREFPYTSPTLLQSIEDQFKTGDIVIHSSKLSYLPSLYYNRFLPQAFIADPAGSNVDTLSPVTQNILGLNSSSDIKTGTTNYARVWLIVFQRSLDEYKDIGKIHPHLQYMNDNFKSSFTKSQDGLWVMLFTTESQ